MPVTIDTKNQEIRKERSLYDNNGSASLSIPPEVLQQVGLSPGDSITIAVEFDGDTIELRKDSSEE